MDGEKTTKKILVIEDEPAINDFAAMILRQEGYEVAQAYDGKDGLDMARSFRPDLIVLDLMLPRMHGYQVSRGIREDKELSGIRILVASAKSYPADIEAAMAAGADDYLTKPYRPDALTSRVNQLLNATRRVEASETVAPADGVQPGTALEGSAAPGGEAKTDLVVRFWGTRGTCPAPGAETVRYGGNTPCTEIRAGGAVIIVDCGTGIRTLGNALLAEFKSKPFAGHLFIGHTHWDHIQGFPLFTPFYVPRNEFSIYSVSAAGRSLTMALTGQMAGDYFPIPLKNLAARLRFVEMEGPVQIGPVTVKFHLLNHPGVAIGFRFEAFGKSVTYMSDHEGFVRLNGYSEVMAKNDRDIVDFAAGSDLFICEAQYTEEDYQLKRGWGHSTFKDAAQRAVDANVKRLALFHHDPAHTDAMLDRFSEDVRDIVRKSGRPIESFMAAEGQTIVL
ncbi:MAG: response regulator [Elusimicrobiota bacterium]